MGTITSPWKKLVLDAIDSNSHLKHSNFFQLATLGCNGRPSNRTVVFRGFQDDTERILINTDLRTRKIEELKRSCFAELCWYFTDSWEQFRINGTIEIIDGTNSDPSLLQQREKSWFESSMRSRMQYLGPKPGLPCLEEQSIEEICIGESSGPVDAFCLLVFDPCYVDYLNLKRNVRHEFQAGDIANGEKVWTEQRINP